jgi:hypothetical protein
MSFIPAIYNFEGSVSAMRGDTFNRSFEFTNYTLTGKALKMEVRKNHNVDPILTFTSSGESPNITVTGNVLELEMSAAGMEVKAGEYDYDLQATIGGVVETIMRGKFIILQDITD